MGSLLTAPPVVPVISPAAPQDSSIQCLKETCDMLALTAPPVAEQSGSAAPEDLAERWLEAQMALRWAAETVLSPVTADILLSFLEKRLRLWAPHEKGTQDLLRTLYAAGENTMVCSRQLTGCYDAAPTLQRIAASRHMSGACSPGQWAWRNSVLVCNPLRPH